MHDNPLDRMTAWLREAMDASQRDAEAATWHEDAGTWRAAASEYATPSRPGGTRWYIEDSMEDGVITTVDPQASDDEGVARHIARQSPAVVLRRIAADRKTLDLHAPITVEYDDNSPPTLACRTCGSHFEYPTAWPCATLRLLAEGYGWTEEDRK